MRLYTFSVKTDFSFDLTFTRTPYSVGIRAANDATTIRGLTLPIDALEAGSAFTFFTVRTYSTFTAVSFIAIRRHTRSIYTLVSRTSTSARAASTVSVRAAIDIITVRLYAFPIVTLVP